MMFYPYKYEAQRHEITFNASILDCKLGILLFPELILFSFLPLQGLPSLSFWVLSPFPLTFYSFIHSKHTELLHHTRPCA